MGEKVVARFKKRKGMGYHFKKGHGGTMQVVEVPMSELRKKRGKKGKKGKRNREKRKRSGGRKKAR